MIRQLRPERREALEERMSKEVDVLSFRTTKDTGARAERLVPLLAQLSGLPSFRLSRADVLRDAVERGLKQLEELAAERADR